ncbi:MAG: uracil phosphoribosyltransferase [Cyclobacteriaceae bacterium]|nr:uracil phosphoribosyltransferase [Cyclobacteriaceae bacterium]
MSLFILNQQNSVAARFLSQLRNVEVQNDSMRFRKNLQRIGEILAYEISKSFDYKTEEIQTPLATASCQNWKQKPVLINILRAGIPFFDGFLNYYDDVQCGFIGAYRVEGKNSHSININMEYVSFPEIDGKTLILADPMLATGKSLVESVEQLLKRGKPAFLHIAAVIASKPGIEYIQDKITIPFKLWVGDVDPMLNELSYIVPGLGDAGDLAYGPKL